MNAASKSRQLGQDIYDEIARVTKRDAVGPQQNDDKNARLEELNVAMQWNALALALAEASQREAA